MPYIGQPNAHEILSGLAQRAQPTLPSQPVDKLYFYSLPVRLSARSSRELTMIAPAESLYKNITLNDIRLASAYYPLLIDLARHKHCLTYSELVERAKNTYPSEPSVQNAIAVSTGRKLDVVRLFTAERNLPDLTSLIISKSAGECGTGFTDHFDPVAARAKVFAFDWSSVSTDFDGFIKHSETVITPRVRIKRPAALKLMSEYYSANKAKLPTGISEHRDLIIDLLMDGFSPTEAFTQARTGAI